MLPQALTEALAATLGATPQLVRRAGGGCINSAALISVAGRRLFVKWNSGDLPNMFAREASGLRALAASHTVAVPAPVAWAERNASAPAYLVLEAFDEGRSSGGSSRKLGQQLARMHRCVADEHGFVESNYIGSLPQRNSRSTSWVTFFADERLGAQQDIARRSGALTSRQHRLLETLRASLAELVPDDAPASLLHGDLWGGNYAITQAGEPIVFDPAVYHGHREVEIAFTRMFGGFSREFYDAYEGEWALESGFEERARLYNLYPLLVHANLFGGGYAAQAEATMRYFVE